MNTISNKSTTADNKAFLVATTLLLVVLGMLIVTTDVMNFRSGTNLSTIGSGTPVIVLVSDGDCIGCDVKQRAQAAFNGLENVEFRVADVCTRAGRHFVETYQAKPISVMYFDGDGRKKHTVTGLQSEEDYHALFLRWASESCGDGGALSYPVEVIPRKSVVI